jgi:hypothetical protein
MKHKHVISVLAALLASCNGAPPSNPPSPYTPPPGGAPRCELSADCPAGTHCDLGECIQDCSTANACSNDNAACTPRGRCVTDLKFDHDPPPSATNGVTLSAPPIRIDDGVDTAMLSIDATPADADVRYRVDPRVPWLHVRGALRGDFRASLRQMLMVDRQGLGAGNHDGTVVVHTTAGDVTIAVSLVVGLSGAYEGVTSYTSPRALGQAPIHLDLIADGANVKVKVDSTRSPLFPGRSGRVVAANATWDGQALKGSLKQKLTPFDLGGDRFLDRDIGREFSFELHTTTAGGLTGTFTERWVGILPQALEVTGSMTLARLDSDVMPFDVGTPDLLPPDPVSFAPTVTTDCATACRSVPVAYGAACGQAMLDDGARLDGGLGVGTATGYDYFVPLCVADLSANDMAPVKDFPNCVRPGNLVCAHAQFGTASGDTAAKGMAAIVSARAGVGLLVINDALVKAFQEAYQQNIDDGAVIPNTLADLESARSQALATLRWSFDPHLLANLDTLSPSIAAMDDWRALRRLSLVVARHRMASEERGTIKLRNLGTDPQVLQQELGDQAINLLIGSATIAELERAEQAPQRAELGMLGDAMTGLTREYVALAQGGDPFGFPPGYVEFLYDPAAAGGDRTTNFQFVLAAHATDLSAAVRDEAEAVNAVNTVQSNVANIQTSLRELAVQTASQLVTVCGAAPGNVLQPDIQNCGSSTGDMFQARNRIQEELNGVQIAQSRIEALHERVRIQVQRLQTVDGIRADEIAFMDASDNRIEALTEDEDQLSFYQDIAHDCSSIFSLIVDAIDVVGWTDLSQDISKVADNISDTILNKLKRNIEEEKQRLEHAQQLRTLDDNRRIEYVNGMAAIQELLVQGAELNLELGQAQLRVISAVKQVATLAERVRMLQAEDTLRAQYASDSNQGFKNDPAFRVIEHQAVVKAIHSREVALRGIYAASKAFEYEINWTFPGIETELVPARRMAPVQAFVDCMTGQFSAFRAAFHVPQRVVDEISVREHILGIKGAVTDPVTGETISEAEQFRRRLLQPSNIGPEGTVGLTFATTLDAGNGVLSTGVCNDQLSTIQVKLVGDSLGDAQARVKLRAGGAALQRSCASFTAGNGDIINDYKQIPTDVELAAGVNVYPTLADAQLFGRSIANTQWTLAIPPGSAAPQNADLDLTKIEDIVLRIEHAAVSLSPTSRDFNPICQ